MPHISQALYKKMKNSYRHDVARRLAKSAMEGKTITYGALSQEFGGAARGWGNTLGGIAIRCKEAELPLLPVVVVNQETGLPSVDAVLYEDLGLRTAEHIRDEQARCFAMDWKSTALG